MVALLMLEMMAQNNAAKTDKMAFIMMMMMMIKCLYDTYNTFGSTNNTLIKCKVHSQFEPFDSHDSVVICNVFAY